MEDTSEQFHAMMDTVEFISEHTTRQEKMAIIESVIEESPHLAGGTMDTEVKQQCSILGAVDQAFRDTLMYAMAPEERTSR